MRGARTHEPITGVGDVFEMAMHGADMGDYVVDNHVVAFASDREIAWAPATHGGDRGGQVWAYRLEPADETSTRVTHVYDWSAVTLERLLPYLPVVDADGLAATLERLASLVEGETRAEAMSGRRDSTCMPLKRDRFVPAKNPESWSSARTRPSKFS